MVRVTLPPCPQLKGHTNLLVALQAEELGPCLGSKSRRQILVSSSPAGHHACCVVSSSMWPHGCNWAPSNTMLGLDCYREKQEKRQVNPTSVSKEDLKNQEPIRIKLCSIWLVTERRRSKDASNTEHSTPKWRLSSIPPLLCKRGTKPLLQPRLTIATRFTVLMDEAAGDLLGAHEERVSALRVICMFSINTVPQQNTGHFHQPLGQAGTQTSGCLIPNKKPAPKMITESVDGPGFILQRLFVCPPSQERFLELVEGLSSSRARCDSDKPYFSGVLGEGGGCSASWVVKLGGPDSFLVHAAQAGLLCLGDNICTIWGLADKKNL